MLCESNGIYINHTLLKILHYVFYFQYAEFLGGGGRSGLINLMHCFFQMCTSKIQRRSGLKSSDKKNMIKANKAVLNKEMGHLAAAKQYNVPRSVLCDYVRSNWDSFQATLSKLGRKPIIPPVLEERSVENLLLIERKYFGCTRDDVGSLDFQLAVQNKIPSQFSIAKAAAGKDWFKLFFCKQAQR